MARVFCNRRIDCSEEVRRLLLRARRFLSVDVELHAAVSKFTFELIAVELWVVEFEDAGG